MLTENKQSQSMNPQQQQVEKLRELGSQIRQVREEKSISIDEVATKTRIQARLLVAIEEGNFDNLPEPVYIQGLIKQFAEALGLNGREYAAAFPTGTQTYTINPSWRQLPAAQLRPLHLYIIYILLIIASISGLSYLIDQRSAQKNTQQQTTQQQVKPESAAAEPEAKLGSVNSPASPEASQQSSQTQPQTEPVEVKASIKQKSWMQVISDGETVYQGNLAKGQTQTWTAQKQLTLKVGNAGGVVVEYNQQPPQVLGNSGQVKEVTYSPQN